MENVDRILKSSTLPKALALFRNAGYGLSQVVLDASRCGVPQKRKRFFLIGELNGEDCALEFALQNDQSSHCMTIRDYLQNEFGVEYYYRHPRSYARRGIFSIDEPSPTIRGVNRPLPQNYKVHPEMLHRIWMSALSNNLGTSTNPNFSCRLSFSGYQNRFGANDWKRRSC